MHCWLNFAAGDRVWRGPRAHAGPSKSVLATYTSRLLACKPAAGLLANIRYGVRKPHKLGRAARRELQESLVTRAPW